MANDFTARVAGISVELGMSVQNKSGIWCKPTVKMDLKIDGGTNPQQREAIIKQAFDEVCDNIEKTISERVEELGMQVDLASNAKKSAQNEAMVKVSGTVQEKKARVEQLTEDKALVEAIYRRAYNSLKVKLEMAEKIYSGLKKSLSKRIAEVDLDRFSKDKYTRDPEDPMED